MQETIMLEMGCGLCASCLFLQQKKKEEGEEEGGSSVGDAPADTSGGDSSMLLTFDEPAKPVKKRPALSSQKRVRWVSKTFLVTRLAVSGLGRTETKWERRIVNVCIIISFRFVSFFSPCCSFSHPRRRRERRRAVQVKPPQNRNQNNRHQLQQL